MARGIRLRCSCGRAVNAVPNQICPSCKKPIPVPHGGVIYLYRPFSLKSLCTGFGIYLNNEFYGAIGAGEYVTIPMEFGKYTMDIRMTNANDILSAIFEKSTKLDLEITPENPVAYIKSRSPLNSIYKIQLTYMSADEINAVFPQTEQTKNL